MFRREPRDPLERQLSQFRQQLEQTTADEELALDEDLLPRPTSESSAPSSRTSTWQPPEPPARQPATPDRMLSIVAANARWQGTLQTEGSLVIHGHVEGTIQAAHDVTIFEGATVRADIAAQQVIVRGSVQGRIDARGRLEIHPGGEVIGEVSAPSLVVHEGARLSGKLKMGTTESTDSAPSPGGYR